MCAAAEDPSRREERLAVFSMLSGNIRVKRSRAQGYFDGHEGRYSKQRLCSTRYWCVIPVLKTNIRFKLEIVIFEHLK